MFAWTRPLACLSPFSVILCIRSDKCSKYRFIIFTIKCPFGIFCIQFIWEFPLSKISLNSTPNPHDFDPNKKFKIYSRSWSAPITEAVTPIPNPGYSNRPEQSCTPSHGPGQWSNNIWRQPGGRGPVDKVKTNAPPVTPSNTSNNLFPAQSFYSVHTTLCQSGV